MVVFFPATATVATRREQSKSSLATSLSTVRYTVCYQLVKKLSGIWVTLQMLDRLY